jgi:hypothetical protein
VYALILCCSDVQNDELEAEFLKPEVMQVPRLSTWDRSDHSSCSQPVADASEVFKRVNHCSADFATMTLNSKDFPRPLALRRVGALPKSGLDRNGVTK